MPSSKIDDGSEAASRRRKDSSDHSSSLHFVKRNIDENFTQNMSDLEPLVNRSSEVETRPDEVYSDEFYKTLDPDKLITGFGVYGFYQMFTYTLVQALNFSYSASIYIMSYVQISFDIQCRDTFKVGTKIKFVNIFDFPTSSLLNFLTFLLGAVGNIDDLLFVFLEMAIFALQNRSLAIGDTCNIISSNATLNSKTCGLTSDTELKIPHETAQTNLLVEFDLTCSHWIVQELGLTVFTTAAVFAVPFMCMLADRFGRRPLILYSSIVAFIANMLAAFSPNYPTFLVARAVIGAASDTYLTVATVATCEFVSEQARIWIVLIYNVAWSLGMLWIPVVTFITDDWRWRYGIAAVPGIYCAVLYFFLPESPHWMLHHNRVDDLKKYIKISSKMNRKTVNLRECVMTEQYEKKHESFVAVLKSPRMLLLLSINGFLQFTISLVYYAITFLSVDLSEDKITGYVLSSVLEIPGGVMALPLMMWFGRRSLTSVSFVLQGVCLIIAPFVMHVTWSKFLVMLTAKVIACMVYSIHPIWANEQYPTSVRSLAYSIMNIPQSLGIIASPYLKHLKMHPEWVPLVTVGVMSIVAGLVGFLLPETKDTALPTDINSLSRTDDDDNVSEIDEFERDRILEHRRVSPSHHAEVRVSGRAFAPTEEICD